MIYGNNRHSLRAQFFDAWKKYKKDMALTQLETEIVHVIIQHPEYHQVIDNPSKYEDYDYSPEAGKTNPFLHLSLHLAIRDQIKTDRPHGITHLFTEQLKNKLSQEQIEHQMMEVLADVIWQSQRTSQMPNETHYLDMLKHHLK
ncbi:DUF1841 family protein [Thiotrichales bacterium 19S3-7]|nr:DUF1841 family protein [Thiotrichales bacterium 19S3-7]MCF6800858.1 DUF1841 family protein [Thiotrichales bacterium 19S3-11]